MPKSHKTLIFYGQSEQKQQHALTPLNVRFERKKTMNSLNLRCLFGAKSSKTLAPDGRFSKLASLPNTLKGHFARKNTNKLHFNVLHGINMSSTSCWARSLQNIGNSANSSIFYVQTMLLASPRDYVVFARFDRKKTMTSAFFASLNYTFHRKNACVSMTRTCLFVCTYFSALRNH